MSDIGWWRHGIHKSKVREREVALLNRRLAQMNRRDLVVGTLKLVATVAVVGLVFGLLVGEINSVSRWIVR